MGIRRSEQRRAAACEAWDIMDLTLLAIHPPALSCTYVVRGSQSLVRTRETTRKVWQAPCLQERTKDNKPFTNFFFFHISRVGSRWRRSGQIGALSSYIGVGAALPALRIASETSHRLFRGQAGSSRLDSNCTKLARATTDARTDVCLSHILPRALV